MLSTVSDLTQLSDSSWLVNVQKNHLLRKSTTQVQAKIVFAGAGGGTLRILQKAGLPEVKGYAGMPVSGKFLVCQNPKIIEQNRNKVYSPAAVGAPPMSVPHLDWRTIYGRDCIFFGPFAGFKPTVFNNTGSVLDWLATLKRSNILSLIKTSLKNMDLVAYLVKELLATKRKQLKTLRQFVPNAKAEDWTMIWAGQRITTVHPDGTLQFGTEVVSSKDKTLVGLLGASPGASVSPHIAIEVLDHFMAATTYEQQWHGTLAQMIMSYGRNINTEPGLYEKVLAKTGDVLLWGDTSGFQASKTNILKTFRRIDTDSSGALSKEEMSTFLNSQGVDEKSVKAIIDKMDADQSGDITRDEFVAGFSHFIDGQIQ